jgi:hypothetical protein
MADGAASTSAKATAVAPAESFVRGFFRYLGHAPQWWLMPVALVAFMSWTLIKMTASTEPPSFYPPF